MLVPDRSILLNRGLCNLLNHGSLMLSLLHMDSGCCMVFKGYSRYQFATYLVLLPRFLIGTTCTSSVCKRITEADMHTASKPASWPPTTIQYQTQRLEINYSSPLSFRFLFSTLEVDGVKWGCHLHTTMGFLTPLVT